MAKSIDGKTLELDGVRIWYDAREGLQISVSDGQLEREMKSGLSSPNLCDALIELLGQHNLANGRLHERSIAAAENETWQQAMNAAVPGRLQGAQLVSEAKGGMGVQDWLTITTWILPSSHDGLTWMDYQQCASALADQLRQRGHQVATLSVAPVGAVDDANKEKIGTVSDHAFRVWSLSKQPTWTTQHEWAVEAYARTVVLPLLIELGCGQPVLAWVGWLTQTYSDIYVMEANFAGLDVEQLLDEEVLATLRETLGVTWVRLIDKRDRNGLITYSLGIGSNWRDQDMQGLWVNPKSQTARRMNLAEYGQHDGPRGREIRDPDWWR